MMSAGILLEMTVNWKRRTPKMTEKLRWLLTRLRRRNPLQERPGKRQRSMIRYRSFLLSRHQVTGMVSSVLFPLI